MFPAPAVVVVPPPPLPGFMPARGPGAGTAVWCGGWHESSAELERGLHVIEHEPSDDPETDPLMAFVSFL
ncbi:hypothetical protein [Ideonella sp. BN130291]|uniref:hypothetical protein n=1 Tax=Ideonella sp. BN130291 TaxID=3112940 RepID=UPI002E2741E4|nr:hypothetical protein [Ideonella sp. BN130291]